MNVINETKNFKHYDFSIDEFMSLLNIDKSEIALQITILQDGNVRITTTLKGQ